jgi:hypothetical protein
MILDPSGLACFGALKTLQSIEYLYNKTQVHKITKMPFGLGKTIEIPLVKWKNTKCP